jgi:hypothetical protein
VGSEKAGRKLKKGNIMMNETNRNEKENKVIYKRMERRSGNNDQWIR